MKSFRDNKLLLLSIISKSLRNSKQSTISTEDIFKASLEQNPPLWGETQKTVSNTPPRALYGALKYLSESGALERTIVPSGKQGSPVNLYQINDFGEQLVSDMERLESVKAETREIFKSIKQFQRNGGHKTPNQIVLEV